MPVLSSNPSTIPANTGTWVNPTNVYSSNDTYATHAGTTQNTEYSFEAGGFNFSALTASDVLGTTTATVEAKTGTNNRAQIKVEILDGTTVLATRALQNLTNTDTNYTLDATLTLAQLQSANLKVRVTNKRIVSQASTTSVDWVKIDVNVVDPKIETLTDTFDTLDTTTKWNTPFGSHTAVATGGRLAVTASGATWSGVQTKGLYNMAESSFVFRYWHTGTIMNGRAGIFRLQKIGGAHWIGYAVTGGEPVLNCYFKQDNTNNDFMINPYDPVAHAWLRCRMIGNTAYWDTSPDGLAWTNRRTLAVDATKFVSMQLELSAGSTETGQYTVYYDDINLAPTAPKIETLTDTFDTQIDPVKWAGGVSTGSVWDAGRLRIESLQAYSSISTGHTYDLTESSVFVKVVPPPPRRSRETALYVRLPNNDGAQISIYTDQSWLNTRAIYTRRKEGGTDYSNYHMEYDPSKHAYLRIRMSGNQFFYDTSPDGVTWTNIPGSTQTTALNMTACRVQLESGQWLSEPDTGFAYFDNVNTAIPPAKMSTFTDDFATEVSLYRWRTPNAGVSWEAGQAKLVATDGPYTYLESLQAYDLRDSAIFWKMTPPTVVKNTRELNMRIGQSDNQNNAMVILYSSGGVWWAMYRNRDGGANAEGGNHAYDPAAHAYFRITMTSGTLYYDTSPDASTWTNRWSHVPTRPNDFASVYPSFECGQWSTENHTDYGYIDNVNVVPAITGGRPKVWTGSAHVPKPGKYWNGSAWLEKPWKRWTGSSWQTVK